ncbi:hypothetical protein K435DRAFT_804593 [Dendrothele bispora CBS 962.96]|uniref:Phosphomannose isomerase type I catalytic domain-containing protein n=1 Tax=Dendrothele bispora (strain CBS 962.96) TaxID=1314807 RepID=A0A4S8LDR6_DENBC|nr:hypothetical protein K435DRAFT_804593 [Dendrothele bispora CBS 962.96]
MIEKVIHLKCHCNEYPWRKTGSVSLAARLAASMPCTTESKLDENSLPALNHLPAYIPETGEKLQDVINTHAQERFSFVPWICQHGFTPENPSDFTDPNHKPEIAVALTDFEAFCGFKATSRYRTVEPLRQFLPQTREFAFGDRNTLRDVVKSMLSASEETVDDPGTLDREERRETCNDRKRNMRCYLTGQSMMSMSMDYGDASMKPNERERSVGLGALQRFFESKLV